MATVKYASKDDKVRLAKIVDGLHADGWTRPALVAAAKAVGFEWTPAQQWRVWKGNAHQHEVQVVDTLAAAIKDGKIKRPEKKASGGQRSSKIAALEAQVTELKALVASMQPQAAK